MYLIGIYLPFGAGLGFVRVSLAVVVGNYFCWISYGNEADSEIVLCWLRLAAWLVRTSEVPLWDNCYKKGMPILKIMTIVYLCLKNIYTDVSYHVTFTKLKWTSYVDIDLNRWNSAWSLWTNNQLQIKFNNILYNSPKHTKVLLLNHIKLRKNKLTPGIHCAL